MTAYWVEFGYNAYVERQDNSQDYPPQNPIFFLGHNLSQNPSLVDFAGAVEPGPLVFRFLTTTPYAAVSTGTTGTSIDVLVYTDSIINTYPVGTAPDPTIFSGPLTNSPTIRDPNNGSEFSFIYTSYAWAQIDLSPGVLTIDWQDKAETASFKLTQDAGNITNPAQTGRVHFTDTDPKAAPTGSIGSQTAAVTDANGNAVPVTSAQTAALEAAFSIAPEAGNTNNGAIDWTYNPDGTALNFLTAGETAQVQSEIQVTDQNGNKDTATVTVTLVGPVKTLFTTGADRVDFNSLTPDQQSAIAAGADLYNGLGGNDVVTLPNVGNYNESLGSAGGTLNWNPNQTFSTGSVAGNNYTVNGGDGSYNIALGAGNDTVNVTGTGTNTITGTTGKYTINLGGTGVDNVTITGDGASTIVGNAGADTIAITGNGANNITAGTGAVSVTIKGDGNNTIDASSTARFDSLTATGSGNERIIGGNFGNNITSGAGNDFLKGGNGSDLFFGVGIKSTDAQRGNDEINGASYTNLNSTDIVSFDYPRASYDIKFLPTLTLSDGSSSIGFGVVVSSKVGKDTIANWNALHFSDETIRESDVYHASLVAYGLWSLADAFDQLKSFIGLSQNISDPKLKAIGDWFDSADKVIGALAQGATESDFQSAIKVTLTQAANAITAPFISQAKSILDDRIDNLPMPDSWKTTAKTAVDNGAIDLAADISLATGALVDRVAAFNKQSFSTFDWAAQWQQWMNDVKQAIRNTYKLFDSGDPQQEWNDPHLPTPQAQPPTQIVIDGYLSGATVFADANGTGLLAANDVSTTTDRNGNFTLTGGSGPLYAFGGTDTSTGLPFKGQLSAPVGSIVITPLTTLISELSSDPSAEQKVLSGLGLSSSLNLTTLDPIAASQAGDATGAAAEAAGAKVYDTASLIASALAGAGGTFASGLKDAFSALAKAIDGSGISLVDETGISALISSVALSEHLVLGQGVADSVAAVIVASNAALDQKLQSDGAGTKLLSDVAAVEFVAQGPASNLIEQAANSASNLQPIVTAYTGTNLENAITARLNSLSNNAVPAITGVFANPSGGDLNTGKLVEITLTTSGSVTVGGSPVLALNDGGTATYNAAKSTSTSLAFDYTVGSADTDVASLAVTQVSLNGGTIRDSSGRDANLSLSGLSQSGLQIDNDSGEQAALTLTVNGGNPIDAATAGAVPFTVAGLEPDDSGTVSFSDGSHAPVVINVAGGVPSATTADLAGLNDGNVTATLSLSADAGGNSFTPVTTDAVLDADLVAERPSMTARSKITLNGGKSAPLGIVLGAVDSDDTLSVSISGVAKFQSITAAGARPAVTRHGSHYTYTFANLPASDWDNGLVLHSSYKGQHYGWNHLTVTVSQTTPGETGGDITKKIAVTNRPAAHVHAPWQYLLNFLDPRALATAMEHFSEMADLGSPGSQLHSAGLLSQYMASSFVEGAPGFGSAFAGEPQTQQHPMLVLNHG
jgi:hypothetical protein